MNSDGEKKMTHMDSNCVCMRHLWLELIAQTNLL